MDSLELLEDILGDVLGDGCVVSFIVSKVDILLGQGCE